MGTDPVLGRHPAGVSGRDRDAASVFLNGQHLSHIGRRRHRRSRPQAPHALRQREPDDRVEPSRYRRPDLPDRLHRFRVPARMDARPSRAGGAPHRPRDPAVGHRTGAGGRRPVPVAPRAVVRRRALARRARLPEQLRHPPAGAVRLDLVLRRRRLHRRPGAVDLPRYGRLAGAAARRAGLRARRARVRRRLHRGGADLDARRPRNGGRRVAQPART
ncbi:hypothetical protein D3C83_06930 [compost metagenome]